VSVKTEERGRQDMTEKSKVVLIKVSALEVQSILKQHLAEEGDNIKVV
jgi:hypothetical protein